jgi:hypothetical protein
MGGGLSLRAGVGLNWDGLGIEDRGGGRPTIKRALAGRGFSVAAIKTGHRQTQKGPLGVKRIKTGQYPEAAYSFLSSLG